MMRECTAAERWRRWGWVAAGAVVLLGLVGWVYRDVGGHGWVPWDDDGYIYENGWVRGGLTWEGMKRAWTTGEMANWHPLTWMSLMLDRELFGDWAGGGHLESAALHGVNALLLWWVVGRMTGCRGLGWWVALLWAVHPLRVESVAWASERKDVLAALFGLAAVGSYLGPAAGAAGGRTMPRWRLWGVAGWMAASLMCKPTLVTLPCLLLLLDGWPLGRWECGAWWGLVREKWMLWALAGASCAATLAVQQDAMASVDAVGIAERAATALKGYGWYLEKLAWPSGLAFFYPREWAAAMRGGTVAWGAVLLAASAAAAWAWKKKGWGWAGVGWFWFLGTLVPMIGVVQVGGQAWADRYSYWPHMGLVLAVVCGASVWAGEAAWRRRAMCLAGAFAAVALGIAAHAQVGTWADGASLARQALAVTGPNAKAEGLSGDECLRAGRWTEAVAHYGRAVSLEGRNSHAWVQLGLARYRAGNPEEAQTAWETAIRLDGRQWKAMNNLAWVLAEEGRPAEARTWMDRAMLHKAARENAGVWDTEAAVRRAEGDEPGAQEAERTRDALAGASTRREGRDPPRKGGP